MQGVLIPITCPVCGVRGRAPCDRCAAQLRAAPSLPAPPGVESCSALLDYDGAGRELVARLKYRNARASLAFLARGMAELVTAQHGEPELVTWAPTTPARRRARGFDQAQLLARGLARRLALPCHPLLRRAPGPPQTGGDAMARRRGPTFSARHTVAGRRVLLVDDVVTTGATVAAAARALRQAGAARVDVVAAARTRPSRRHVHSAMIATGSQRWR